MELSDVSGLIGKLADLSLQKALELYGVRGQVELMQMELNLIEGFLRDVDSKPNKSNLLISWMNELRNVANRIDNVMDSFLKEIEKDKNKGCCTIHKLKFWKKPLKLNDISAEIGSITQTLKTLYERGTQLPVTAASDTGTTEDTARLPFRPTKPSDIDDSQVVGLDFDKNHIIGHLLDESISRRTVLSIVGVGGLGKTTLAQKVYNSSELEGRFQCRAWLYISKKFNENNILRKILYSIKPTMKDKNPPLEEDDLLTEVQSYLSNKRNKYLIILDDVWGTDLWTGLEKALPDANNGSRIVITTRYLKVARAADRNTKPYLFRFLTDDESVALLFRKAFQRYIHPEDYPPSLRDVAKRLTKKCGGLPLAVVVLGGILSMNDDDTFDAWNKVYENMNWHDQDGKQCMNILAMSYEDLPYNLKRCFLYFAPFPENYNISAQHITGMWVAEELIPKDGAGSLEDRAEKCLQELVKRCLVEVTEKSANGFCKNCRMHDLLRDLAIHKANEINFFSVLSKELGDGANQKLGPSKLACRVALQFCTPTDYGIHTTITRSLLCFGEYISNYKGFRLLRVLVLECINMSTKDMPAFKKWIEGLVHLRYLGFRKSYMELDSISFSGLKSLETLDCMGTNMSCDNPSLWEIPTLRHVITHDRSVLNCPLNWDHLQNLQTLKWVHLEGIPKLECNVNLRTLKISNSKDDPASIEERWQRLRSLLSRTEHLVSLAVNEGSNEVPLLCDGTHGLSCHEKIQSLCLKGRWACVPSAEMFPKNLTKLKLLRSHLAEDPMPILERLQTLRILHLLKLSYMGTKICCSTGGFPSLQKLKLRSLWDLSEWEIKEGAMPVLCHLEMDKCRGLDTLPQLQNVSTLQVVILSKTSELLLNRLQTEEDRYKIEHIPSVHIKIGRFGFVYKGGSSVVEALGLSSILTSSKDPFRRLVA